MTVIVNGEPREVNATTLSDVLARLGYGEVKVATAVNGAFVPAGQRAATRIAEGDAIEVVSPRQGG